MPGKQKAGFGDWALDTFVYAFMALMGVVTLLPFLNVLSKSVSADWAVISGKVGLWPIDFQLQTMKFVVTGHDFLNSFRVSIYITVAGTVISMILTAITAYPLSKKELKGIKFILVVFVFTMMFNGGLIPSYMLIKDLHLINSLWSVILPGAVNVFNLLIVKSYYESLPESLEESARIDGASNIGILFRIIIPLSVPVMATVCLFIAVGYWNEYFNPMLYLTHANLKPLQVYMRDLVMNAEGSSNMLYQSADDMLNVPPEGVRAGTIIASTIPIVMIYPFLQKYFIKGVLIGSVKG